MTSLFLTALAATQIAASGHALTVNVTQPAQNVSIPLGAQRVPMLSVQLQASCDAAVTVRSIVVTHKGLGSIADLERAYVLEGGRRVSRAASFTNNRGQAVLRLGNMTVPACGGKTLSIVTDYARNAGVQSEHALVIASFADISADTSDIGGTLSAASRPVRIVPGTEGTVNVEYLPQVSSVSYGSRRTLLRMRLSAEGEDVLIHAITLTNDGKARDADLQNLFLGRRNDNLSGTLYKLDGDKATFTFDPPLLIEKGSERLLQLTGDIRASRKQTIDFEVSESSDIDARARGRSDTFQ